MKTLSKSNVWIAIAPNDFENAHVFSRTCFQAGPKKFVFWDGNDHFRLQLRVGP